MGTSINPIYVTFQAQGVSQVGAAFDQIANKSRQSGAAITSTFVGASGRVTAFGRSSVQAINATGFAVSQLASTGQVGFKSLASSAAGFASFFGVGGLIASGVISLGLVLADFWNRQRKDIEETKKVMDTLGAAAVARRGRDEPVAVASEQLATATKGVAAAKQRMAEIVTLRNMAQRTPQELEVFDKMMAAQQEKVAEALKREMEALRQVNDARNKSTESENKEVQALAAAIGARQATNAEIERANVLLGQARFALEATKNASAEDTATMMGRAKALKVLTALTDAFKKAQDFVTEAEKKRRAALADQVNQLAALSSMNKLTGQQVFDLAILYARLNTELLTGNVTLERRVELEQQLATIRKASLQAPPVGMMSGTLSAGQLLPGERAMPGRGGSAITLPMPNIKPPPRGAAATGLGGGFTSTSNEFGDAFAQSLQSGMAAGVTQFIASGSIEGMWNNVGGALVAGLSTINPWLAFGASVLQGLIASMLGGGPARPRSPELPIDIRRVITDPSFRQPVRAKQAGGRPLYVNTPRGSRELRAWSGTAAGRGIP